ncbi:prepilin-type N-terminal cleavage/methylation domain-containing protein [Thalassotalea litorea]|uniref:Prepilin-type N-terminal cleavage/methylation domain-containing protein n=1 Tax=Thalassotalea litorea TaxID=2020715 RepID=A0A5R9IJG2_9GAMM|nr:prepilin-type N-terminal cleavage/methylation domain-containing protein [Thalassotalea litorea]TLU61452.1 prepilin-type N-terminal cleavage/methylation domain-containing protein [Thalassotalea litorea]
MKSTDKLHDEYTNSYHARGRVRGFSLLELLIALAIFSYVFLGIAKLQLLLAHNTQSNYRQLYAAQIADDLLNRIDRNYVAINDYVTLATSNINTSYDCESSTCSSADIARNDLFTTQKQLKSLPFALLKVESNSNGTNVSIYWHPNPPVGANISCPQQSEADYHCLVMHRFMTPQSLEVNP